MRTSWLNRARRGELPDTLTLREVAALSLSDDLGNHPDKDDLRERMLRSKVDGEKLTVASREEVQMQMPMASYFVGTARLSEAGHREERPHDAFYSQLRGDVAPAPVSSPPTTFTYTKISVTNESVAKLAATAVVEGWWSEGLTCWTGVAAGGQSLPDERSQSKQVNTSELKRICIGSGHVEKDGRGCAWRTVIDNKKMMEAARLVVPHSGGSSQWDLQRFKTAALVQGYVFHFAPFKPQLARQAGHPDDALDAMVRELGRR